MGNCIDHILDLLSSKMDFWRKVGRESAYFAKPINGEYPLIEKGSIMFEKVKEKINSGKAKIGGFVKDHKNGLIRGGIVTGIVAAAAGTVGVIVNRCGGCSSMIDDYEYDEEIDYDYEEVDPTEDESEEDSE